MVRGTFSLVMLALAVGCANPLNQVTADRYLDTCADAERSGNLAVAEEACSRALANVHMGNLGKAEESQKLYNLARIKRQLGKFAEAEDLLKQSLAIEAALSLPSDPKVGRRCVELSIVLAAQDRWREGADYLERMVPMAEAFSGNERAALAEALRRYADELRRTGDATRADKFAAKAAALRRAS